MMMLTEFLHKLPDPLHKTFSSLTSPARIQAYLDSIPYVGEDLNRSPFRVMVDRQCHCLDGGLLAAAALWQIGYPPLLLDLVPEPNLDDDHVLAVFKQDGLWGAVAKSNYVGLRYREPIHRSLRELAITYFEDFYNYYGLKSLRGYTRPMNLAQFNRTGWMWSEEGVEQVTTRFYRLTSIRLLSEKAVAGLQKVDERAYQSGMVGTNIDGVFKPKSE